MENEKRFWISNSPMYREGDDFNTVYIVMQSTGQYEDSFESPLNVYDELEDAKKFINEQEDWKKHVNETAIGTDVFDICIRERIASTAVTYITSTRMSSIK